MATVKFGSPLAQTEPSNGVKGRFIFYAEPNEQLPELLRSAGAQVVRRMRGGEVLAYADDAILARITAEHPEVGAEPDFEMGFCQPSLTHP